MAYTTQLAPPDIQTTGFVCPICTEPLSLEITPQQWETMASNNAFGWPWNTMLPRGLVFGRVIRTGATVPQVEPIPRFMHIDGFLAYGYTPMHSRCFRAARHAWVQQMQANCAHENVTYHRVCPECRQRQW
jgi:hypothetical protein